MIPYVPSYQLTEEEQIMLNLICIALPCFMALAVLLDSALDNSTDTEKAQDEDDEEEPSAPIIPYEKPALRPRPTKAPKTNTLDILDKPILGFLWHWPGATAKEISAALRQVPGGAEKSLINSRLYTLMNKGLVTKAKGSGSAPRWVPIRSAELNAIVFGK
jgi:hypothetical protein